MLFESDAIPSGTSSLTERGLQGQAAHDAVCAKQLVRQACASLMMASHSKTEDAMQRIASGELLMARLCRSVVEAGLAQGDTSTAPIVEKYCGWLQSTFFDGISRDEHGDVARERARAANRRVEQLCTTQNFANFAALEPKGGDMNVDSEADDDYMDDQRAGNADARNEEVDDCDRDAGQWPCTRASTTDDNHTVIALSKAAQDKVPTPPSKVQHECKADVVDMDSDSNGKDSDGEKDRDEGYDAADVHEAWTHHHNHNRHDHWRAQHPSSDTHAPRATRPRVEPPHSWPRGRPTWNEMPRQRRGRQRRRHRELSPEGWRRRRPCSAPLALSTLAVLPHRCRPSMAAAHYAPLRLATAPMTGAASLLGGLW